MLGTVNLPEYAAGALLIILLPGPNSIYVLSVAARRGVRTGYRAAAGVFLGDSTLIALTSLGAASLLKRSPVAFDVVKYLGAGYLAMLGLGMLRSSVRALRERRARAQDPDGAAYEPHEAPAQDGERPFRRALLVSLLNPKAILFFLAFFTQFVNPAYPDPAVPFAVLAIIIQGFSVLYLSSLILGGDRLAAALRRRRRLSASMTGGVGTLFLGFAAKLATATLH
ncbi:MAG: leucine efflux protein LeuE [Actinocrinis sp.]